MSLNVISAKGNHLGSLEFCEQLMQVYSFVHKLTFVGNISALPELKLLKKCLATASNFVRLEDMEIVAGPRNRVPSRILIWQ